MSSEDLKQKMSLCLALKSFGATAATLCIGGLLFTQSRSSSITLGVSLLLLTFWCCLLQTITGVTILRLSSRLQTPSRLWWIFEFASLASGALNLATTLLNLDSLETHWKGVLPVDTRKYLVPTLSIVLLFCIHLMIFAECVTSLYAVRMKRRFAKEIAELTPSKQCRLGRDSN